MSHNLLVHLKDNQQIWKAWKEKGITDQQKWEVWFNFYCTKSKYKEMLISGLEEDEVEYEIKKTRMLLFWTGYHVIAKITQPWDIAHLDGKTGRMFVLAESCGCLYEGCGAIVPS